MAESPESILLKRRARRRLVGAIALVVLVVVFLPVVLDQQPRPVSHALTVQIPSQDGSFSPRVPGHDESPGAEREKTTGTAQGRVDQVPEERAGSAERTRSQVERDAYFIPLGAFLHSENAKQVREKAESAGIKSYTEALKTPQGEQTRVRAGPFATRESAERAREKLRSLGIEVGQVAQR